MFFLKLIRRLYKGLMGADSPTQIALGFALGLLLGLVPLNSGLGIAVILAILIFKVSFSFALAAWAVSELLHLSVLSFLLAKAGYHVLEAMPLRSLWETLLNLPVVSLLGLERYHVMGGAVAGLLAGIALFFPITFLVNKYRDKVATRLSNSRLFKTITNLWLIRFLRWVLLGPVR